MQTPRQITVAALVEPGELRAASFIVTLYGDVVEPRGGLLWMGTLVEVCALVGISETRVRTAVSRLVAAGPARGDARGPAQLLPADRGGAARVRRRRRPRLRPAAAAGGVADRRGRGGRRASQRSEAGW